MHSEFLKFGGNVTAVALTKLFNKIIETRKSPQGFKDAMIVLIHKKVPRDKCENYRPISLLSSIYKVFITIICERIKSDLYEYFPETQAAYQKGRGTTEQIFSIMQLIEKCSEFNVPLKIVMIDFTKAFDSIKWNSIWEVLDKTSINKR